jgi:hypothetical protein
MEVQHKSNAFMIPNTHSLQFEEVQDDDILLDSELDLQTSTSYIIEEEDIPVPQLCIAPSIPDLPWFKCNEHENVRQEPFLSKTRRRQQGKKRKNNVDYTSDFSAPFEKRQRLLCGFKPQPCVSWDLTICTH